MLAKGIVCAEIFASSLFWTEVVHGENMKVFVVLLLAILNESIFSHFGRDEDDVGCEVFDTFVIDKVSS